ncbi:MAG: bifunctional metallophosphatase/5'-nucleotidase [Flavobacteriales bacterium]
MWNRREFIKSLTGIGCIAGMGNYEWVAEQLVKNDLLKLTILHTNDWHSHIDPWKENDPKHPREGGFLKRDDFISKVRVENEHVILLDAGDIFQGTPYFNFYGGELELKLMSSVSYDAATMGNHDFDNGLMGFEKMLPHANFPFVCSNYSFENTILKGKTKPYHIINKGPLKIGIIGIGIELAGLVTKNLYEETQYLPPVEILNNTAKMLKKEEKCNLVICISHLGFEYKTKKLSDRILAAESVYTDIIIGGHTHTFLDSPIYVPNKMGQQVLISQAGWAGLRIGKIDVIFAKQAMPKNTDTSENVYLKREIHRL